MAGVEENDCLLYTSSTNTKDGNVTTSTVELKTSRPGVTKTEQIKTGYSNVNAVSYTHLIL